LGFNGFDIHRDSHPDLLRLIPLVLMKQRFEIVTSKLKGNQQRLLYQRLCELELPKEINANLSKSTKDWQADEYLSLIGSSYDLFDSLLSHEQSNNWNNFCCNCWKILRRCTNPSAIDEIEREYVNNFDDFQALFEDCLSMFSNIINCHSIFHAFHTCRRVGSGIMIWAKVMEIKHKYCKEEIRHGNKIDVIKSAARNLQLQFLFDLNFQVEKSHSGYIRLNHDIHYRNLFELPSSHVLQKEYLQTSCVKYLHKDLKKESIICCSNEAMTNTQYVFIDYIHVHLSEEKVLLHTTLLELLPTIISYEFKVNKT
jgi:hypothetical protein